MKMYRYFMTKRGFSIGCQPAGFVNWKDVGERLTSEEWCYSYVEYEKPLTQEQIDEYELTPETEDVKLKGE